MNIHRCTKSSWRFTLCALIMSLLVTGTVALLIYLTGAHGYSDSVPYSRAEPIWQSSKGVATFPFGRDAWTNASVIIGGGPPTKTDCPKHYFACNSSVLCLPMEKRCDGVVDCPRAEDETNCVCAFRIPSVKFCDKYPDCFDQSDERFCSYCPLDYFNCGNGKCIPRSQVCDSTADCSNLMDENFCFRLSMEVSGGDDTDPTDTSRSAIAKVGFLQRNKNGIWFPVCANPYDFMQDVLASYACVTITANPLSTSTHQFRRFDERAYNWDFVYHYHGRFIQWNRCLTNQVIFMSCDDVRCGFNPNHLLPSRPRGRIVGGNSSEPGAWPWHGAVYRNGSYECGATLISDYWLVTAAHCFLNYWNNYYEVQMGMLRRNSFTPHQKTYRIDRIIPHYKFNIVTLDFDIALLKTAQPIGYDFWVRPICLPNPKQVENSGSLCTAIGWGDMGEKEDDSDDLQEVYVPLTEKCRNSDRWLCAGYPEGGRDACQGDSGGPLMCPQRDGFSWYIAGVISAGTGCARPKTPGVYTRVAFFMDWIRTVMAKGSQLDPPLMNCPGRECMAMGGGNCIDVHKVCDGHVDCYDARDETNCATKKRY